MGHSPVLEPPMHSLDPADWWMYCDLLQERGAPKRHWTRARRIGDSLAVSTGLTLVFLCPAENLEGHWLRVGKTWFIPVKGTYAPRRDGFLWWRPAWVRQGFKRYPVSAKERDPTNEPRMIEYATGTPFEHGYAAFDDLKSSSSQGLTERYFETHALRRLPHAYR